MRTTKGPAHVLDLPPPKKSVITTSLGFLHVSILVSVRPDVEAREQELQQAAKLFEHLR